MVVISRFDYPTPVSFLFFFVCFYSCFVLEQEGGEGRGAGGAVDGAATVPPSSAVGSS